MMEFIVKVAVLSLVFALMLRYRKPLAARIKRIPLPLWLLYLLTATPLIIFEEDINCIASWCGTVLIPPTLLYIMIQLMVLYIVCRLLKVKRITIPLIIFCVLGIAWEYFAGDLGRAQLPLLWMVFFYCWVAISYMFVALLPLSLLEEKDA